MGVSFSGTVLFWSALLPGGILTTLLFIVAFFDCLNICLQLLKIGRSVNKTQELRETEKMKPQSDELPIDLIENLWTTVEFLNSSRSTKQ